ncbi:MAG: response regulator transcription factor [Campylobacteraceae bacterium]|nr:response regulator transcription factor [Campylobacteraceae bacterium]
MHLNTLKLLNSLSVLVVEDDEMTLMAIRQGLKPHCHTYYEARDGFEGLELFKLHSIDIILTDIHLPEMNGFEMVKRILTLKPNQLFIVMTSYDSDQNIMTSIKEGACSFLRKPLNIKDIQTALLICSGKMSSAIKQITQGISVDYRKEAIYKNGELIFLSQKGNKIFWLFCYNLNRLVSYEMLEDYVYDGESINKGTLHTAILRIKQQLGDDLTIENISNQGYILKSSLEEKL